MKMVLVRRKGYDIPSTIPEPLLSTKSSVTSSSIPPLLPQPSTTATAYNDTMTTNQLPTLPSLQQQLKSQTLPVGMKPVTSSKFPTQLPLLPPPSRKLFTRNAITDSSVRFNGSDEQVDSPTKAVGLSHSNWPSALTSDSGKPLKFHSNMDSTVPVPQTPNDSSVCPIADDSMEKSHLVNVTSNKHKISGPSLTELGPKPEAQPSTVNQSVNEAPVTSKGKSNVLSISHDESGDEDIFDSGDETSALYAVVKPRGAKGKSSESKTLKHSTIRSSNSFKKHKPRPPPKPEPYSVSKYKKKPLSPSPAPADTATEGGYVDPSTLDAQGQVSNTAGSDKVESKESSIAVDDPAALYAKVIKKKPSMDFMEPIHLGQDVLPPEQPAEKNMVPSITVEKGDTKISSDSVTNITTTTTTTTATTTATATTIDTASDNTDGQFVRAAVQLISMARVESDSKAISNKSTSATTASATTASADDKPVPLPRKKHHRSSSLDLNKMFQKRKSAEHLSKYEILSDML